MGDKEIVEALITTYSNGEGLRIKDGAFVMEVHDTVVVQSGTIRQGDKIMNVNGVSIDGLLHSEVVKLLEESGQDLKLQLWRGAEGIIVNQDSEQKDSGTDSDPDSDDETDAVASAEHEPDQPEPADEPTDLINVSNISESSEQLFQKVSAGMRAASRTIDDANLPTNVRLLEGSKGEKVYLVGTAHFSKESCDEVKRTIEQAQPDYVVVELCRGRIDILVNDEEKLAKLAGEVSTSKILAQIRQKGVASGMMTFLLLYISAHITKQLGMAPGSEFRTAYHEARRIPGCKLHFGDRPVEITLQRAFGVLNMFQKIKFAFQILKELGPIKPEDIEKLKEQDMLEQALGEMMTAFPQMTKVFLEERDMFLAKSLQMVAAKEVTTQVGSSPAVVVGVVGLGHAAGIQEHFNKEITEDVMDKIMEIPKPSRLAKRIKFCMKLAFFVSLSYGVMRLFGFSFRSLLFFLPQSIENVSDHTVKQDL